MFSDEVVIVTGAAGNLGAAVAELLAARGAVVVTVDRAHEPLGAARAELAGTDRPMAHAGVDLTDAAACAALVAKVTERFGRVDGLVNTVGTFAMAGIDDAAPEQWDLMYRVNLHTALNMSRAVLPSMRAAGKGGIVNIGAVPALKAPSGFSAYAASKSAVMKLTESMADEFKSLGLTVNAVLPSIIDTPQNRAAMPKADTTKWVTPMQIAEVIVFLLSPAGRGVNGALIPVSGRG